MKRLLVLFVFFSLFSINHSNAKGWLGIEFLPLNDATIKGFVGEGSLEKDSPKNLLVSGVIKNSPAHLANLLPGDIILEADNKSTKEIKDLLDILDKFSSSETINIKIFRKGTEKILKVKLGKKPIDTAFEFVDGSEKYMEFSTGMLFLWQNITPYEKYIPKEIVNKYKKEGLVVSCIIEGSSADKKGIKLYDEIIMINGKKATPKVNAFIKGKYNELTIKRDNKIIKKTVLAVPKIALGNKSRCTSEFSDFTCAELAPGPEVEEWERSKKWITVLECCNKNNVSTIPFHNRISKDKIFYSLKTHALTRVILYYRFAKPEGYLDKINELLEIARKDLVEFEKFSKLYPKETKSREQYAKLVDAVQMSTTINEYSADRSFTTTDKGKVLATKEDITRIKNLILYKIETDGLNSSETLNFIYRQDRFLSINNEDKFNKKILNKVIKEVSWNNENIKYFYKIYTNLQGAYIRTRDYDKLVVHLKEGMKTTKDNFENLEFKYSYGQFLSSYYLYDLINNHSTNLDEIYDLSKLYIEHLESLPEEQKKKLFEIDSTYLLNQYSTISQAGLGLMYENKNEDSAQYLFKALNLIKENNKFKETYGVPFLYVQLILRAYINDNLNYFRLGMKEIKTYISESSKSVERSFSFLTAIPSLLDTFYQKGFYSEMESLIKFVQENIDEEKWSSEVANSANFVIYKRFEGFIEKRLGNLDSAILINKQNIEYAKVNSDLFWKQGLQTANTEQNYVVHNVIPELYEMYYSTKRMKEFSELNELLFMKKNPANLLESDFEHISNLGANRFKIYKTILKYYLINNDIEQFSTFSKIVEKQIRQYPKNFYENKQNLYQDMVENALIIAEGGEIEIGKKLFDFLYPLIVNYYNDQIYQSIWRPNFDDNFIGTLYLDAVKYYKNDKVFQQNAYSIAQLGKNTNTSRDLVKSVKNSNFKGESEQSIKQYQNLQQKLLVLFRSEQFKPEIFKSSQLADKQINREYEKVQKELSRIEKLIKKQNPEYFEFLKIKTADIKDLQQSLNEDQAILDYFLSQSKTHVALIKKDSFKIYNVDSDYNYLTNLTKQIRNSLLPQNNEIIPFEVNKSFKLNESLFLFLKDELKSISKLIIVPDGPLNSLPLHVLATKQEKNCLDDCRFVKFNLSDYTFSYLPTAETLINIDQYEEKFDFVKTTKLKSILKSTKELTKSKTGAELLKKIIKKTKKQKTKATDETKIIEGQLAYLGVGDPNLVSADEKTVTNDSSKIESLKSLFRGGVITGKKIKEIYEPVVGSSEEIKTVANYLKPLSSKILLQDDANEINLKEMDMTQFKIIHFATHGEVSGAIEGLNEPFLVLTPPDIGNEENDGLLTMTEIMALRTNADLVVLSACNTAAGDMPGSEGFSGLAKSFFISGSKSILVSNWYVETLSAQELVINLFRNIKDYPELTLAENFKTTMIEQLNKNKKKSHPIYWAPFVIVGKDIKMSFNM